VLGGRPPPPNPQCDVGNDKRVMTSSAGKSFILEQRPDCSLICCDVKSFHQHIHEAQQSHPPLAFRDWKLIEVDYIVDILYTRRKKEYRSNGACADDWVPPGASVTAPPRPATPRHAPPRSAPAAVYAVQHEPFVSCRLFMLAMRR
jgi:hypothetical protein